MKSNHHTGYTMIELLVVIVIIGILMSIGIMSYAAIGKNARDTRRKDDLNGLQKNFETYYQAKGSYPTGDCFAILAETITTAIKPVDPDFPNTGVDYAWDCSAQSYCLCTGGTLEVQTGNAKDASCDFSGTPKTFYCVRNVQTLDSP